MIRLPIGLPASRRDLSHPHEVRHDAAARRRGPGIVLRFGWQAAGDHGRILISRSPFLCPRICWLSEKAVRRRTVSARHLCFSPNSLALRFYVCRFSHSSSKRAASQPAWHAVTRRLAAARSLRPPRRHDAAASRLFAFSFSFNALFASFRHLFETFLSLPKSRN